MSLFLTLVFHVRKPRNCRTINSFKNKKNCVGKLEPREISGKKPRALNSGLLERTNVTIRRSCHLILFLLAMLLSGHDDIRAARHRFKFQQNSFSCFEAQKAFDLCRWQALSTSIASQKADFFYAVARECITPLFPVFARRRKSHRNLAGLNFVWNIILNENMSTVPPFS